MAGQSLKTSRLKSASDRLAVGSLKLAIRLSAENLRGRTQFKAEIPFDAQERWSARILLKSSQGGGEATVEVEVTPPGYGRWDLLLYLFPFLAVGFLWLKAFLRGRNRKKA